MELRNRHQGDAPTAQAVRTPERRDPRDHPGREAGPRPPDTSRPRPEAPGYDADAEFKRGVPRPPAEPAGDVGKLSTRGILTAFRRRELHHDGVPEKLARRAEAHERDWSDTPHAVVDRPAIHDPRDQFSPDRYGDALARPDGARTPLFNGPPRREQTRQGWAGDCGLIAALGAVAAHRPADITERVRERRDGNYQVTLSEAEQTDTGATPTGRNIELTLTPQVPVSHRRPDAPACAKAQAGASWCAVMEKAFAGLDQTWPAERRTAWHDTWDARCQKDQRDGAPNPRSGPAPEGYVRLHQGSSAWDQAEMLTQLTGEESEVREFPSGPDEWRINRIIRTQLFSGKPVLVGSRHEEHDGEVLPHNLVPTHVYEVTGVDKGKIMLRNPWGRKQPKPMETEEFARNIDPLYITLK